MAPKTATKPLPVVADDSRVTKQKQKLDALVSQSEQHERRIIEIERKLSDGPYAQTLREQIATAQSECDRAQAKVESLRQQFKKAETPESWMSGNRNQKQVDLMRKRKEATDELTRAQKNIAGLRGRLAEEESRPRQSVAVLRHADPQQAAEIEGLETELRQLRADREPLKAAIAIAGEDFTRIKRHVAAEHSAPWRERQTVLLAELAEALDAMLKKFDEMTRFNNEATEAHISVATQNAPEVWRYHTLWRAWVSDHRR